MSTLKDLTGEKFGRLTVLRRATDKQYHRPYWECICDCGAETIVCGGSLRSSSGTRSCGCLLIEAVAPRFRKHGLARSPTYSSWLAMRDRCSNKKHPAFARYGGRGITVCPAWDDDFEAFIRDMGPRPEGTSIDRINNDLGYFKENCRWATRSEQAKNRRPFKRGSAT